MACCEETTHGNHQNKFIVFALMGHDKVVVLEPTIVKYDLRGSLSQFFSKKKKEQQAKIVILSFFSQKHTHVNNLF